MKLKPYPGDALANNDRSSLAAFYNAREQAVREQIIAHQMVQVHRSKVGDVSARVRERARARAEASDRPFNRAQLVACYHREGVNHYQNCRELAKAYVDLINKPNCGALTPAKTSDE